jgi:hypothetical protein
MVAPKDNVNIMVVNRGNKEPHYTLALIRSSIEYQQMRETKRRPISVGAMLKIEIFERMNITSKAPSDAMGMHRNKTSRRLWKYT